MAFLPGHFTQVNSEINRQMIARAVEMLALQPEDRVLDLFCGIGNFSLPLARRAGTVLGIEAEPALVRRAAELERRLPVEVQSGPAVTLPADRDQLEQLLINLVKNAVDASLETGGGVRVGWEVTTHRLVLRVLDEGPGLSDTANLFVPFYSTRPEGTGIGLVLCRQIAEAHGGSISLGNREGARGCVARVILPLRPSLEA